VSTRTRHALILAARALCLSLVCLAVASCTDQEGGEPVGEGSGDASLAPRWVHRYVPKGLLAYDPDLDRWRPESEVPRVPESTAGMVVWEVSEYPQGTEPTPAQQRAADELVERCYAAAVRNGWDRIEKGLADGYRSVDRHHYRNDAYMVDDRIMDPDHPEVLMYYATPPSGTETEGRQRLAGFMFYARDREARGPQIGGPLTIWHYHGWQRPQCVVDGLSINWSVDGECERGTPSYFSGEMMHVWLVDRPHGRFATPMFLPNEVLVPLLEQRFEERGF
jgi:hypothetical protein